MNTRVWLLAGALAVSLPSRRAAAQPGAPHGYVEPCTVGNHQEMYTECESCPAHPADPQACSERLGQRGYDKKCRTRGDSSGWEEVWCITKAAADGAQPPTQPSATQSTERASERPAPPNSKLPVLVAAAGILAVLSAILFAKRAKK